MRVAVIGCGKQGRRHLAALAGLPAVAGLIACDLDPAQSRAAADEFGAACAPSPDLVFMDDGIAAVVIATPTQSHLPLARRAAESGKHFLCEKPFGADTATARGIARDAAASGIVGHVGYLYRFAPAIAAARDAVGGGIVSARFSIAATGDHASWKHRRGGGGAVNELASHMVDLALWFFGPMDDCAVHEKSRLHDRRVIAGAAVAVDAEDRVVARLRSSAGATIMVEADFAAPRFSQRLEIRGGGGVVRASIEGAPDLYRPQAQAFLATIAGGGPGPACDLAGAARAGELLDILRAAPIGAASPA
jgi:predicted dehydrogenase